MLEPLRNPCIEVFYTLAFCDPIIAAFFSLKARRSSRRRRRRKERKKENQIFSLSYSLNKDQD